MSTQVNLILVHGLLGSLSFFKPEDLLTGINVLSPDLHGYGNSPLKDNLTLQDQVDFRYSKERRRICGRANHF